MKNKISNPVKRIDVSDKIAGQTKYIADLQFENMLYAMTKRSEIPRGEIVQIEIPPLPKGYFIVSAKDIKGKNTVKMLLDDFPFFAEKKVNYIGEPILLVVGKDKEKVLQITKNIKITFKETTPIYTIKDALSKKTNPIFKDNNIFAKYNLKKGNVEKAFENAHKVFEKTYKTNAQEQMYIEPQGVIGTVENGVITVYGSMQCPYYVKNALMQCLDTENVRVVQTATGGAFGGKEEYPSLIAGHVAIATQKLQKPVKLIFDRKEDVVSTTKRHPATMKYKVAVDKSCNIIGLKAEIILDSGAYAGLSQVVLQRAMFAATGVYNIENIDISGIAVATNKVPFGAFRGFGAPQTFFAIESLMDDLSKELDKNPLYFKQKHLLKQGDKTNTNGLLRDSVKMEEMIERATKLSNYHEKYEKYKKEKNGFGIGISLFFHGCGFTGKGEEIIKGTVKLKKYKDKTVEIFVSNVEMGQGASTVLRKIAAYELKLPLEQIKIAVPDTAIVPDSGPTVASRTTMIVGSLIQLACKELKDKLQNDLEYSVTKTYKHPNYIEWNQEKMEGDAYPTYSWGVQVVETYTDLVTLQTEVKQVIGVYDIGIDIDRKTATGQMAGGVVQGLGYASMEVMEFEKGKIKQCSMTDYIIPTAKDIPPITTEFVDNPYKFGPFGAKCAGEMPLVGVAPAYLSAIKLATGLNLTSIPATPEILLKENIK
jgi:CO/xanthine dehydrogenase Mo-binding subunit